MIFLYRLFIDSAVFWWFSHQYYCDNDVLVIERYRVLDASVILLMFSSNRIRMVVSTNFSRCTFHVFEIRTVFKNIWIAMLPQEEFCVNYVRRSSKFQMINK